MNVFRLRWQRGNKQLCCTTHNTWSWLDTMWREKCTVLFGLIITDHTCRRTCMLMFCSANLAEDTYHQIIISNCWNYFAVETVTVYLHWNPWTANTQETWELAHYRHEKPVHEIKKNYLFHIDNRATINNGGIRRQDSVIRHTRRDPDRGRQTVHTKAYCGSMCIFRHQADANNDGIPPPV